jgi:protein subunit release factor A
MNEYFAGDVRMYTKYCENRGWRTSVVDMNERNIRDLKR